MPLPHAPGTARAVQASLATISADLQSVWAAAPARLPQERPLWQAVGSTLAALASSYDDSLDAVLNGTSSLLNGASVNVDMADAILATSGTIAYLGDLAQARQTAAVAQAGLVPHATSPCNASGPDLDLACEMQIYAVLADGSTPATIADCANTTSQAHTYAATSALTNSDGAFRATLSVIGTKKVVVARVPVDWTFSASATQGQVPFDVTFAWSGFDPASTPLSCVFHRGDGTSPQTVATCGVAGSPSYRYTRAGVFSAARVGRQSGGGPGQGLLHGRSEHPGPDQRNVDHHDHERDRARAVRPALGSKRR